MLVGECEVFWGDLQIAALVHRHLAALRYDRNSTPTVHSMATPVHGEQNN